MKRIMLVLMLLTIALYGSEENKKSEESSNKQNVRQRYFPVSWEPPSARSVGGNVVVSPPKPNFSKEPRTFIEIIPSTSSISKKKDSFKIKVNGRTKTIREGKVFKIGSNPYKFIGLEGDAYVIEDVKSKKKIYFTKSGKKKK